jgi:chemotaxis protein methyltransferase CheR
MSPSLAKLAGLVKRESGIELGAAQLPALNAALARMGPDATVERLLSPGLAPEVVQRLIDEVTIRETFFFRHRSELDAINWRAALEAARERGSSSVRVWVAGCASGEEAYTVALLACEAFGTAAPPVRILATDIAAAALAQAGAARYGARAARHVEPAIRERYFHMEDGFVCVGDRLRALVELRRHNLVRDPIPPFGERAFDVILCRNVLIYFDRPTVERVVSALEGALAPSGLLVLGAADRLSGQRWRVGGTAPAGRRERRRARPARAPVPVAQPTRLSDALEAADRGRLDVALRITDAALKLDPLNAEAHFIRGLAELACEHPRAAVASLRRALYVDPTFALAAFKLARAHDALGETEPARRAYERTLRTLDREVEERRALIDRLDLGDLAVACHARLRALGQE